MRVIKKTAGPGRLPSSRVTAAWPDIEPLAASNTASGTPDASSATSITWSEWMPCRASGCSALDVRAEINISSGAALKTMRSCFTVTIACKGFGSSLTQRFNSANNASNSWADVGAVTTTLTGDRVIKNHSIAQLLAVDLPTPWPDLTDMRLSPVRWRSKINLPHVRVHA